ncbi:MAG: cytochrome b/b6 domain-containing protein [Candidatus Methanoperedens sp.]|nr:cytochrome b/b6 domain-containing protein [Candidatus Methanoperedens sp.]MCZ7370311.1 cytochrome b/b6 domain-containing protein [Candidatus Methanoperedens sp.]
MRIPRFDASTRALHFTHAMIFIWLLITGVQLFLTSSSLLADPLIRKIHLYASLPFVLLPALIYVSAGPLLRQDMKELASLTNGDLKWFIGFLEMKKTYVKGKFNGGQKANFLFSLTLITGLAFSGFVVWMKSMFSINFVELNFMIHDTLAVVAIMVFSGHILYSFYQSQSLHGIIFGSVEEEWARKHYPQWSHKKEELK